MTGTPVLDDDGRVVGVVSEADLLRKEDIAEEIRHTIVPHLPGDERVSPV